MGDDAGLMALPPRPVIGVLHPGAMGAAVGSALKPAAGAVIWAAAGRSVRTSKRAELSDLVGVPDLVALVHRADVVVSLCPPAAAFTVAADVAAAMAGRAAPLLFIEANTVEPDVVREIGELLGPDHVVDAALVGPPAYQAGRTQLLLSGRAAGMVAALFAGSPFTPQVVGLHLGTASEAARPHAPGAGLTSRG